MSYRTRVIIPLLFLAGYGQAMASHTEHSNSTVTFAEQMLAAVNEARSRPQRCGSTRMPAVKPLTWDYRLERAAERHSSYMANNDFVSHTGSDGSSFIDRINQTGYIWRRAGENVAGGQRSIEAVMRAWMSSRGHCRSIMNANFEQMGASLVENSSARYHFYWTQVFATPSR